MNPIRVLLADDHPVVRLGIRTMLQNLEGIEIVGEAVKTISGELRKRYPGIPWDLISGTRNRLAHGYIDVDLDVIWTIVTEDLPPLIKELKRILKKESGES